MKLHELTALSESSLVLSSSFLAQLSLGKFFCNGYCTDMQSIKWLGLYRSANEIRRALHTLRGLVHGGGRDMSDMLPLADDLQVLADLRVIAIESMIGSNIGNDSSIELEDGTNMADNGSRNGFWLGKIPQALIDLEEDHQPEFLG